MTEPHLDHAHAHGSTEPDELPELDESFSPARRDAIASVEIDGEAVCYDTASGEVHVLNPAAALVWDCLQVPGTIREIVDDLVAELGLDRGVVSSDVLDAVARMVANGLVVGANDDAVLAEERAPEPVPERRYIPEVPTTCMAKVDDLGWAGSISVQAGTLVLGVRANSEETLALLREILHDHLVVDDDTPPNYSVSLAPPSSGSGKRELHVLYRSCELTIRSRIPSRVVEGLLAHLSAQVASQEHGAVRLAALTLVADGRAVLASRHFRAVIERLEPRLNARGITVADVPAVELLADDAIVVPRTRFSQGGRAADMLAAWDARAERGREPAVVASGRYELAGLLFETQENVPATNLSSMLELLARVSNIEALPGQSTLDRLERAQSRVPSRWAHWSEPEAVVDAAAELLSLGGTTRAG